MDVACLEKMRLEIRAVTIPSYHGVEPHYRERMRNNNSAKRDNTGDSLDERWK
jgi:hypothetical protein